MRKEIVFNEPLKFKFSKIRKLFVLATKKIEQSSKKPLSKIGIDTDASEKNKEEISKLERGDNF